MLQSFSSGGSRWIDYLHGPNGLIGAVYTTIPAGGGAASTTTLYYALDHLGSIAATVVSNGTGRTLRSYDNWGKQRFLSGADDTANTLWSQNAEVRGFLGQEQVAQIGLINLNARMYDPWLGRFLQVDPIIGSIYNLQGLNPYSYVMNNPLTDSDPFGLCGFFSCPFKAIGSFVNHAFAGPAGNVLKVVVVVAVVATFQYEVFPALAAEAGLVTAGTTFAQLPVGLAALDVGLSGALGGALNTGTLRGALIGAATAEVFWGVSQGIQPTLGLTVRPGATPTAYQFAGNATLQAAVGCASSAASGGRCGSGALSAGVGSLITSGTAAAGYGDNPFLKAAVAGLGGGTGAALTGGRFGDGFYLAASAAIVTNLFDSKASSDQSRALSNQNLDESGNAAMDGSATLSRSGGGLGQTLEPGSNDFAGGIRGQSASVTQVADVIFGHGDRHVLDPLAARQEILQNLPPASQIGGPFWGRTPNYEYRAFPLPNGDLNIGTYYYR